jgi:hypothetical protein
VNYVWLSVDYKEVNSEKDNIESQKFNFGKISKIDHQEYYHIQTEIAEDKVHILRVYVLRNLI